MRSEVLEWQLELLRLATEQDLDDDGRVQRHGYVGRHGGRERLTDVIDGRWDGRATAARSPPRSQREGCRSCTGVAVAGW